MVDKDSSSSDPKDSVNFRKLRYFCDLLYAQNHPAVKEIRSGFLKRRTRILKSYNSRFYVLTASGFLHQFKSDNFSSNQIPQMSLCLRECEICEHSPSDSQTYKFSLKGFKNGNSRRIHTFIFKTSTYDEMIDWYNDIKKFTGLLNMPENEFRDYIVALQTGNSSDRQATNIPNDASCQENKFSLVLKDDVNIMTSASNNFYEAKSPVHNGQTDDMTNKEDINKECIINGNGDLNKDSSFDEKNGISVCMNGDITSEHEKSEKNMSTHTSALLNTSGVCVNDSIDLKDTALEFSSSSYSSTNEYSSPMEIQNSSLDHKSDLGKPVVDVQKNSNQRDRSCSLHPVFESQANNNQGLSSLPLLGLSESSSSAITQSKFKEDLGQNALSNLDTTDISDNKLDLEQMQSSKNIGSMNGADNISGMSSDKGLDAVELCSRKSMMESECQLSSVVSGLEVLKKSNCKEFKENSQVLDDNDYSIKKLH